MRRAVREGRVGTGDPRRGGEPWADAVTAKTAGKQDVGGAGEDHIACGCRPPPCPPPVCLRALEGLAQFLACAQTAMQVVY